MVSIKEVQIAIQMRVKNRWRMCKEFDSPETLERGANSATRLATIVECQPGLFRFAISLAKSFRWSDKANALKMSLTFDEGDPIKEYEVVVLKPEANAQELGLETLKSSDVGDLSHCLETICMPLKAEDPSSPWLQAGFEFGRYSKDGAVLDRNTPSSTSKGRLRIDVVQCAVERNPRRNNRIALAPKLSLKWRTLPPTNEVTLKPELVFDPSQVRSSSRRCRCQTIPGVQQVSFTFFYREVDHYKRIEKEDIDIVEDEVGSTPQSGQRRTKKTLSAPKSDSTSRSRSSRRTTAEKPPIAHEHSKKTTHGTNTVSAHQKTQPRQSSVLVPSATSSDSPLSRISCDDADSQPEDDWELTSLLGTATNILPQIERMGREGHEAEQAFVRKTLEQAVDDMAKAQIVLDKCKAEVEKWRNEDERITKRLQSITQRECEDEHEKEERKIHDEAKKVLQRLNQVRNQRLEMQKRHVSRWSTGSSSPTRGTKRARPTS